MANKYLGNAFSLQMLTADANVSVRGIDKSEIPFNEVESRIGHQDIADKLGVEVNRVSTRLDQDETLYVAQYIGERLPEGCTKLPEDAEIKYFKVTADYDLDINTQINALTTQGLEQIRKHLQENGNIINLVGDGINDNKVRLWSAYYTDNDGFGTSAYYTEIELGSTNEIYATLSDGVWLYEQELNTCHVMDILTIIKEGHGTYRK